MSLSTLPFDVLDMIADYLDDPKSLASAAATSKSNYEALMPVLCGVILTVVNGSQDSMQRNEQLCNLFLRRPDLLGYVKVVHICGSTSRSEAIKQGLDLFASIVEGATKINKVTIKNFKDSLEEGDRLYKALQSCTNLRTINIVTDSKMLDMQLLAKFQVPLSNIRLKGGHCNGDHKSYDLWRNLAPYQESLRLLDMQGIHYPIEKAGPTVWAELKTLSLHGCKLLKNTVAECFPNIEVLNLLKVTHEDGQKDAEITTPMAFVKLQQLEADVHSLKSFLTNIFAPSMFSVTLSNSLSDKLLEDKVVDVLDGFLTRVAVPILELQIETPFSNLLYELSTKSERTDVVILRVALRLPQVRSSSDVGLLVDLVVSCPDNTQSCIKFTMLPRIISSKSCLPTFHLSSTSN